MQGLSTNYDINTIYYSTATVKHSVWNTFVKNMEYGSMTVIYIIYFICNFVYFIAFIFFVICE